MGDNWQVCLRRVSAHGTPVLYDLSIKFRAALLTAESEYPVTSPAVTPPAHTIASNHPAKQ